MKTTKIKFESDLDHMELSEAAIFIAYPHIHNIKNYKRNGKKRRQSAKYVK